MRAVKSWASAGVAVSIALAGTTACTTTTAAPITSYSPITNAQNDVTYASGECKSVNNGRVEIYTANPNGRNPNIIIATQDFPGASRDTRVAANGSRNDIAIRNDFYKTCFAQGVNFGFVDFVYASNNSGEIRYERSEPSGVNRYPERHRYYTDTEGQAVWEATINPSFVAGHLRPRGLGN